MFTIPLGRSSNMNGWTRSITLKKKVSPHEIGLCLLGLSDKLYRTIKVLLFANMMQMVLLLNTPYGRMLPSLAELLFFCFFFCFVFFLFFFSIIIILLSLTMLDKYFNRPQFEIFSYIPLENIL